MKLILTSDLHYHVDWFEYLLQEAPKYDLISIAGDLMDGFSDPVPQMTYIHHWVHRITKSGCRLVFCCGNHDMNSRALPAPKQSDQVAKHWMDTLFYQNKAIPGGNTCLLEVNSGHIILTSCRYNDDIEVTEKLLSDGLEVKLKNPDIPWLVLHHQPPSRTFGKPDFGSNNADMIAEVYKPDYLHCGHVHDAPFSFGQCHDTRGQTLVLNAGCRVGELIPSVIKLDTENKSLSWI